MKQWIATVMAAGMLLGMRAQAQDTWVDGYTRSNGTYVQGHYRSRPDGNAFNNYSSQGNVNPYTGQSGTVNPYNQTYSSNSYGNGYSNGGSSRRGSLLGN